MIGKIKIVNIRGVKSFNCPYCGFPIDVPLITLGMEKLRHMQATQVFVKWQKQHGIGQGIGNVRILMCSRCETPIICTDRFSIEY